MYEPIRGTGQNIANPIATILKLMLRYSFGLSGVAEGYRTYGIMAEGMKKRGMLIGGRI